MPTVLITGASRGLGLEFARQYAADGWHVIATCRDPARARDLRGLGDTVDVFALDVTDHGQVQGLAKKLKRDPIDVLLNSAGIYGPRPVPFGGVDYGAWADVFRVNAMAPLKVCECFVDHVARSDLKRMVTVTSGMGSIGGNDSGGSYIYRSSKAALNQVMKTLSVDLRARGITVVVLHPGWVRTDMGGPSALIDAPESVTGMRAVIAGLGAADNGRFYNYDGTEIPW